MANDLKWPIAIYGLFMPISVAISKFHGRNLDVLMMLLQTLLRMLNSICTKLFFENSKILKHIGSQGVVHVYYHPFVVGYLDYFQLFVIIKLLQGTCLVCKPLCLPSKSL